MPNYQNTHSSRSKKRRYRRLKKKRHENRNKRNKMQQKNNDNDEQEETKNNDENITYIDGSIMEGGGQIVRHCICLSGLLHKAITIQNIRRHRKISGLRSQHKFGIATIQRIFGGQLIGNHVKSTKVEFYPNLRNKNKIDMVCDMRTAAPISLLMQTILPCLLFSQNKSTVTIKGGTNVFFSPSIDYVKLVLIPMLNKLFGIQMGVDIKRRGFFPKGNGEIELHTRPIDGVLPCFDLSDRGKLIKIYGIVVIAGDKMDKNSGYEMVNGAIQEFENRLKIKENKIKIDIDIEVQEEKGDCKGCAMTIVAETDRGCLFGCDGMADYITNKDIGNVKYFELGVKTAKLLIDDFVRYSDGCTDKWLQDQLIIFMALAANNNASTSQFRTGALELHTKTVIHFVEKMSGATFRVKEEKNSVLIQCDGIGLKNQRGK